VTLLAWRVEMHADRPFASEFAPDHGQGEAGLHSAWDPSTPPGRDATIRACRDARVRRGIPPWMSRARHRRPARMPCVEPADGSIGSHARAM